MTPPAPRSNCARRVYQLQPRRAANRARGPVPLETHHTTRRKSQSASHPPATAAANTQHPPSHPDTQTHPVRPHSVDDENHVHTQSPIDNSLTAQHTRDSRDTD